MRSYGYIKTKNLENYQEYSPGVIPNLPGKYKLKDIGEVWDQGNHGSCVSHSIAEMYNFYQLSHGKSLDVRPDWLYHLREDKTIDGMMPSEGFKIMKSAGDIKTFSRVPNLLSLKQSIIANGPALIAVVVRDEGRDDFWNGSDNLGGHAISVVGYDSEGLIIKNSWGRQYGNNGFYVIPYEDFKRVLEAWTIIE